MGSTKKGARKLLKSSNFKKIDVQVGELNSAVENSRVFHFYY